MTLPLLPTFLLTGFLGSGKTTLLRRLLTAPEFQDSAVIVNEFGEISLDHDLIAFSSDQIVVLNGGCVCCSIREDLETVLRELFEQRDSGAIPTFSRIIIETTGLADPVPIIATLRSNPLAVSRLAFFGTVSVVDAVLGSKTMLRHGEAAKQAAVADRLVISKCDLVDHDGVDALERDLRKVNPWADIHRLSPNIKGVNDLFSHDRHSPAPSRNDAMDWVRGTHGEEAGGSTAHEHHHHAHAAASFGSFSIVLSRPVDWTAFGLWLSLLLHRHGENILRVKGLLGIVGLDTPVLLHAVQHVVHPPVHMDDWPSGDRRSRIVFVTRGIDPDLVKRSLSVFTGLDVGGVGVERQNYNKSAGAGGSVGGRPIRRATAPRWLRG